jgi:hypothetical protein
LGNGVVSVHREHFTVVKYLMPRRHWITYQRFDVQATRE